MSWKTVKNFLLILLAAVNVFLAFLAFRYYTSAEFTDAHTAEKAVAILKKNGIDVSRELLSVKNDNRDILFADYNRENYVCLVASVLFGKEADGIYMLPDGVRAETLEGDSALLGYDMSIRYTKSGYEDAASSIKNAKTANQAEAKAACAALEKILFLPENSLSTSNCTQNGKCIYINVKQSENSTPLYAMNCTFGIADGKIVYADGKHFIGIPKGEESAQLLNRINILFSEKERGMTGEVKSIELCYTLYEEEDNGRMLYVPSYTVTYTDGTKNTINAINKKLY